MTSKDTIKGKVTENVKPEDLHFGRLGNKELTEEIEKVQAKKKKKQEEEKRYFPLVDKVCTQKEADELLKKQSLSPEK